MAKARAERDHENWLEDVTKKCKTIIGKHQREQCLIYEHASVKKSRPAATKLRLVIGQNIDIVHNFNKPCRVVLPITVEEYQVAQLWSVAEASKNETGGGEGIEVIKNEPFKFDDTADEADKKLLRDNKGNPLESGQYTHKIYHLESRVPAFVRLLAPKGSLEIHELAWNAYPFCRTIILNPDYMNESFAIVIETLHVPNDRGLSENVHNLNEKEIKKRVVKKIDIAAPVEQKDYKEEWDPTKYQFKKDDAVRGPLVHRTEDKNEHPKWMLEVEPVMCAYKLVSCRFKWFGLQNRVEKFIQNSENRIFTNFHRQVFCWMDKWHGLTMENIRELEEKTKEDLDKARQVGKVKGTQSNYEDDGKK